MIRSSIAFALALIVAGCAGVRMPAGPAQAPTPRPRPTPVDVTMHVAATAGRVDARVLGGPWRPVETVAPQGTTHLVAVGGDAEVAFGLPGAASGRLWLRAGTVIVLSAGPRAGSIALSLEGGEARFSGFDTTLQASIATAAGRADLTERDVLLRHSAGGVRVADTASDLAAASWTLVVGDELEAAGIGALDAVTERGEKAALELVKLHVDARPAGDVVEVEVEHVFANRSEERLEGTFRFPMPDGAILTGLAMEIGGVMMDGELVEREKARSTYQSIVDSMRDPALLEWDGGSTFQLRVFPIEARGTKRIVLRYLAPVERGAFGARFVYATAAPALQGAIGHFLLSVDGSPLVDVPGFAPGRDIVVPIADERVARAPQVEVRGEATWTALRLAPRLPVTTSRPRRDVVLVVDTSRSALESRALILETVDSVLGQLRPRDRFVLLASDVDARAHADSFVAATDEAVGAAGAWLAGIDPDGASDLSAAFDAVGRILDRAGLGPVQVVYVGDGAPTWGETDPAKLRDGILADLDDSPMHAVVLGRSTDADLLREVAGLTGGRALQPRTAIEVRRFGLFLAHAAGAPRLRGARVLSEGADVHPRIPTTLFAGDALVALLRSPAPPENATLTGTLAGKPFAHEVLLSDEPRRGRFLRTRWAAKEIAWMQSHGAEKEAIVALSKEAQVMSRHTSFLVLESEEAYRRHGIERRQASAEPDDPKVSGRDLESVAGDDQAGLHPDHIQPGDPEVRVPAPADARAVVVVFPFGETKVAAFEPDLGAWTVRFLVDKATADGTWPVVVRITHADGRVETLRLSYTIDTQAPTVDVTVVPAPGKPGSFVIEAKQVVQSLAAGVRIALDVARVEVRAPSGRILRLGRVERGLFRKTWTPRTATAGPFTLHVVATDVPGNRSAFDVRVGSDE